MLRITLRRAFAFVLAPLSSNSSPSARMPRLVQCFQHKPGHLTAIWHAGHIPAGPHFDFDSTQKHPSVPSCSQLVMRGVGEVPIPIEVVARPDEDEIQDLTAAGFWLAPVQPDPCHVPESRRVLRRLAKDVERRHGAATRANRISGRASQSRLGSVSSLPPRRLQTTRSYLSGVAA
jgi:hypothetical protein